MFMIEKEFPWALNPPPAGPIQNLSRRSFLRNSALAAGSTFVLGTLIGCKESAGPAGEAYVPVARASASGSMAEAGFQPNPLIGINDAGDVFVVCTRSEMGQGIRTGMPPAIADEMEADWSRVTVLQADGDPKYGDQNTDGSRSVRNHMGEWLTAGAAARMMLVTAAARKWGVPETECEAINHKVVHAGSNQELGYGELAALAADVDVPAEPVLKPRDKWRYIGTPMRGIDNVDIGMGKAVFGIDAKAPGMVFASVERCPVIGGTVASFDPSEALKVPGVKQVVQIGQNNLPPVFNALSGVAVVADNTWAAMQGRKALQIEWDLGPNADHSSESYRAKLQDTAMQPGKEIRKMGDVGPELAKTDQLIEATYYVPMLAHAPMETPNALAWVKDDGTAEIWAPTQGPQGARASVAAALGTAPENVTMHVTLLGGGFGRKSKPDYIVEAALISKEVGAPVKVTWTREDEIKFGYYHAPSVQHLKASLGPDGIPTAWLHRTTFPSISSTFAPNVEYASDGEMGLGFTSTPFDIPNMLCENGKASAHVRIGWMRSVSNIHHAFAVSAFVGELAHAAGQDQKDYLLKLIGPDRNLNHLYGGDTGPYGESLERQPYESSRLKGVVELAAEKAGWGKDLPDGHGMGIAVHYSFTSYIAQVVHASVEDGQVTVHRVDCAVDCGTYINPDRVKSQMEGAVVFGMSIALHGEITTRDGAIVQGNFDDYPLTRLNEVPETHVHIVENEQPAGGVGEPGVPPFAPALTNAILAATGSPVRDLPIRLA